MTSLHIGFTVEETHYDSPSDWRLAGAAGKANHIISLCKNNALTPQSLLEVGAGDGSILRKLDEVDFCKSMHALEISSSGVSVIKSQKIKSLDSCEQFDGYTTKYPDGYFDLVILSHVLEHVEYERLLLREILRIGRNYIIEVPLDARSLFKGSGARSLLPSYGHINVYTPESLIFLLHTENFFIVDDMLGLYSFEVKSYMHFEKNGNKKTDSAIENLYSSYLDELEFFNSLPRYEQEKRSSYYTVLARRVTSQEALGIKLNDAMAYIRNKQFLYAGIIVDGYKTNREKVKFLSGIVKICLQENLDDAASYYIDMLEKLR